MTAAFGELVGPTVRRRGGRFLCVLALVLPVPLFAALGLSLPLPATVERIAAKLVPFGDSIGLAGGRGSITLASGELRTGAHRAASAPLASAKGGAEIGDGRSPAVAVPAVVRPGPRTGDVNEAGATKPTAGPERTTAPSLPQHNAGDPSTTSSSGGGGGSSGGSQTGSDSDPGDSQPIETVTNTANGAVESVTTAVTDASESVDDTTNDAVESVTSAGSGALGGIKAP
jgi:hypothetical protein